MYHSTRSECLVLIKSTIVQVDDRALGASHELELAVEGREALVDLELVLQRIDVVEIAAEPGLLV